VGRPTTPPIGSLPLGGAISRRSCTRSGIGPAWHRPRLGGATVGAGRQRGSSRAQAALGAGFFARFTASVYSQVPRRATTVPTCVCVVSLLPKKSTGGRREAGGGGGGSTRAQGVQEKARQQRGAAQHSAAQRGDEEVRRDHFAASARPHMWAHLRCR
jgi:hypothetical protein